MEKKEEKLKTKGNKKGSVKRQSSILITCISCILLLLVLCYFGMSNTKGTYSLSVSDCTWGSAWASGTNIYVSVTPPSGSTYGDCCTSAGYKTSTTNTCLQYATKLSNGYGYYYYNKYSSIYNCVSGYQDAGTNGTYCYNCNSNAYWNGSTCVVSSTSDEEEEESSCNFGDSYVSGGTAKIYVNASGSYTNAGCCSKYGFGNDGYYCTQSIKESTVSEGSYQYYYSTSNSYCTGSYSNFSTASSIGASTSSYGLSYVCHTDLVEENDDDDTTTAKCDVNATGSDFCAYCESKNGACSDYFTNALYSCKTVTVDGMADIDYECRCKYGTKSSCEGAVGGTCEEATNGCYKQTTFYGTPQVNDSYAYVSVAGTNKSTLCSNIGWTYSSTYDTCYTTVLIGNFSSYYNKASGIDCVTSEGYQVYSSYCMKCTNGYTFDNGQCKAPNVSGYNILYDYAGGSGSKKSEYVVAGDQLTFPSATRSGYTFLGWYASFNPGLLHASGDKYRPTYDMKFIAKWSNNSIEDSYFISFYGNGGTASETSIEVEKGKSFTFPTATRTDCTFKGWYFINNSSTLYSSGNTYTPSSDLDFYAKWSCNDTEDVPGDNGGGGGYTPTPDDSDDEPTTNPDDGDDDGGTSDAPSDSDTPSNPDDDGNVTENPTTGSIMIFVVWVITLAVIIYGCWYIKRLRTSE